MPKRIVEDRRVDGRKGRTIACKGQLAVDDIVTANSGFAVWIVVGYELETCF